MSKVIFDLTAKDSEQQCNSYEVITLNLTKIKNPEPTSKMILVLRNLYDYGFISLDQHNEAVHDFFKASTLIEEYQQDMHKYFRCGKEQILYELEDLAFEMGYIWGLSD